MALDDVAVYPAVIYHGSFEVHGVAGAKVTYI